MSTPKPPKRTVRRITVGTQSVPVYWKESEQGWQAKWTEHGETKRKFSRSFPKLKKAIEKLFARQTTELDWNTLTPDQRAVCQEVVRLGITMNDITRIGKVAANTPLSDVLDQFLETKRPAGAYKSERNFRDLSSRCKA